jgi:hypothetical protein
VKIILLIDYKGRFESKYSSVPYRSGMDLALLEQEFSKYGIELQKKHFYELDFNRLDNSIFLYTSDESRDDCYKSYIEDIIYGLSINNRVIIPEYKFLKAHNNKVFMEILRATMLYDDNFFSSKFFGSFEEYMNISNSIQFPVVAKPALGSKSKGVSINNQLRSLNKNLKRISRNFRLKEYLHDIVRVFRHKGYIRNSIHSRKFIIQYYIGDLEGDWKVLVYGDKYYPLYRQVNNGDFRASGSGKFSFREDIDFQILDFASIIKDKLNTPILSLDIAFKNNKCFLLEFQVLYFGTYTIENSPFFFIKNTTGWEIAKEKSELEKVYVKAISDFIKKQD